jgi:hypothetical protein
MAAKVRDEVVRPNFLPAGACEMAANTRWVSRQVSAVLAVGLLLCYSVVTLGGGHGIMPAGVLLLSCLSSPPWLTEGVSAWVSIAAVAAWAGAVLALASCFVRGMKSYAALTVPALAALGLSVGLLVQHSEISACTLMTALPFIGLAVLAVVRLASFLDLEDPGTAADRPRD